MQHEIRAHRRALLQRVQRLVHRVGAVNSWSLRCSGSRRKKKDLREKISGRDSPALRVYCISSGGKGGFILSRESATKNHRTSLYR